MHRAAFHMTDAEYERWLAGLTIRGDEAYLPGEKVPRWHWHRLTEEELRHYHRDRSRRLRANPEYRERERQKRRDRQAVKRAA